MEKNCWECGQTISGRADKKFCDDTCRNAYNNKLKCRINNHMRRVNRRLSRNRNILAELNPNGTRKTSRQELVQQGFDFNYFTSIYETRKGGRYYFVYEQGYIELPDGMLALVVQKDYVNKSKKV